MIVQVYIPSVFLESRRAAFFGLKIKILIFKAPNNFGYWPLFLGLPQCREGCADLQGLNESQDRQRNGTVTTSKQNWTLGSYLHSTEVN